MFFIGNRGGGYQSLLTEYKIGDYRKLTVNKGGVSKIL